MEFDWPITNSLIVARSATGLADKKMNNFGHIPLRNLIGVNGQNSKWTILSGQ
jgi:hypothetical protein